MSMLDINLNNVEELVFRDKFLQKEFPEFRSFFDQWRLAQILPAMRQMGKKAILDFMNSVRDEHLEILKNYFKQPVTVDRLDYAIVKNVDFGIFDAERELNEFNTFPQFSICRDKSRLYISFLR